MGPSRSHLTTPYFLGEFYDTLKNIKQLQGHCEKNLNVFSKILVIFQKTLKEVSEQLYREIQRSL